MKNKTQSVYRTPLVLRGALAERFKALIPPGMRMLLVRYVIEELLSILEGPDGDRLLAAYIRRRIRMSVAADADGTLEFVEQ
jgi:hypothetical protein